jgi:hypothetical protein
MYFDWLLNPLAQYSFSALCLVTSLTLVLHARLTRTRPDSLSIVPELVGKPEDPEIRGLKAEVEQLRESMCRLEETMPTRGTGVGLNLTKRAAALRMHRRGEAVSSIAAALETPSNEIALLLKLQALTETKAGA